MTRRAVGAIAGLILGPLFTAAALWAMGLCNRRGLGVMVFSGPQLCIAISLIGGVLYGPLLGWIIAAAIGPSESTNRSPET